MAKQLSTVLRVRLLNISSGEIDIKNAKDNNENEMTEL